MGCTGGVVVIGLESTGGLLAYCGAPTTGAWSKHIGEEVRLDDLHALEREHAALCHPVIRPLNRD